MTVSEANRRYGARSSPPRLAAGTHAIVVVLPGVSDGHVGRGASYRCVIELSFQVVVNRVRVARHSTLRTN